MRIAPVHEVGDEVRSWVVRLPAGRDASGHTALPCTPRHRTWDRELRTYRPQN
ncbi:hypothetical protein HMPREF0574_1059 [Mobiluncus curtisii subsp. curtisii ATCC 35241]|nr:hypothetical protein HMPREF0574_1059 [Mobiluncus curtisii subsp. curtisii ATCC 35241]